MIRVIYKAYRSCGYPKLEYSSEKNGFFNLLRFFESCWQKKKLKKQWPMNDLKEAEKKNLLDTFNFIEDLINVSNLLGLLQMVV